MDMSLFLFDESYKLAQNNFTKIGYTFTGWNTERNGSGISFSDEETVLNLTLTNEVTLYAQWEANTYQVIFKANGGHGSESSQSIRYDVSATLNQNSFTRTGYTFSGWNTSVDGTGDIYSDMAIALNLTQDIQVELYAQWTANTYTIGFDSNTGMGTRSHQSFVYDLIGNLNPNIFFKTGYSFIGWNTQSDGQGIGYENEAGILNLLTEGHITFYAQWLANDYYLDFDANSGTGVLETQSFAYDIQTSLSPNTFTKTGYSFVSWNTQANGLGISYFDTQSVLNLLETGRQTLYAQWEVNDYYIIFESNDGTSQNTSQTMTYNQESQLLHNQFIREGYGFLGWNTRADGLGDDYLDEASVQNLVSVGEVTLYAQWQANLYEIEFDANGGTGSMSNQTLIYDSISLLDINTFERKGYTFIGWTATQEGYDQLYQDKDLIYNLAYEGKIKLYAQWQPNQYKVIFEANGGDGNEYQQILLFDNEENLTDNRFYRVGYFFVGWSTSIDGVYGIFENNELVRNLTDGSEIVLYAQWQEEIQEIERLLPNTGNNDFGLTVSYCLSYIVLGILMILITRHKQKHS